MIYFVNYLKCVYYFFNKKKQRNFIPEIIKKKN